MKTSRYGRRKFLGAASLGAGGVLVNQFASATALRDSGDEYFLEPGLVYLNTGTLGPCRRDTIEATKKYWEELESILLKFYGRWGILTTTQMV